MTAMEYLEQGDGGGGGGGGVELHPKQHETAAGGDLQNAEQPRGGNCHNDKINGGVPRVPLMALNHVSRLCRSVDASVEFYTKVLGFVLIDRPPSLDFNGAWLFNYGVGVHLVQKEDGPGNSTDHDDASADHLDPMDNHISFQCEDMGSVEQKLVEMGIKYLRRTINEEEGAPIDQLFFNDPDGFMIEICNCNLELVPAGAAGNIRLPPNRHNPPVQLN